MKQQLGGRNQREITGKKGNKDEKMKMGTRVDKVAWETGIPCGKRET